MIFLGKHTLLKTTITACDYDFILSKIIANDKIKKILLISPVASYTITIAHIDKKIERVLKKFDYLVPDSQWVKRSLYFLYGIRLEERVYGPELMLRVCALAEKKSYKIFLYGTTAEKLDKLENNLRERFKKLIITQKSPSEFRTLSKKNKEKLADIIVKSKTKILFVGLGSPLQEVFTVDIAKVLKERKKEVVIIPVGAAFDFIAKTKRQAPIWMQDKGLEWLFRLLSEPRRLLKRYCIYGTHFAFLVLTQKIKIYSTLRTT